MDKKISYAQNREDLILEEFLKDIKKGFYVDIGVNDATLDSVTKIFYDKGWRGINVEPAPDLYKNIKKDRPRDVNLNIGISDKKDKLLFRQYVGSGLSTFSAVMQNEYKSNPDVNTKDYSEYTVDVISLEEMFQKHLSEKQSIDFMKVDVEGLEYEVLAGNNWNKYRPKVLCIEANHIEKNWTHILTDNNYSKAFNDGLNEYYVANEEPGIKKNFYYPNILTRIRTTTYLDSLDLANIANELKVSLQQVQRFELENQILNEKIYPLKYQIGIMNQELQKNKRLRQQIINLAKTLDKIITIQLNKLNRKKIIKNDRIVSNNLHNESSAKELLKDARLYDIKHLYAGNIVVIEKKSFLYIVMMGVYVFTKKIIRYFVKLAWLIIKKIRGKF